MVTSQHTLTIYIFEGSGAVSSPSLDYHTHPEQFCAIVAGLAFMDDARLGLDISIWSDGKSRIWTREVIRNGKVRDVVYVSTTLFYAVNLAGRGTICFLV